MYLIYIKEHGFWDLRRAGISLGRLGFEYWSVWKYGCLLSFEGGGGGEIRCGQCMYVVINV